MSWVLITGATSPLGQEMALSFAHAGKNVVLHYHNHSILATQLAQQIELLGVEAKTLYGEFSRPSGVEAFLKGYEKWNLSTEIIIHNVGPYSQKSLLQTSITELQELFQSNFFASVSITKALLERVKTHRGSIIYLGFPNVLRGRVSKDAPSYALAKETLATWTRSLAKELLSTQVRVNMVSPGYLEYSLHLPKASTLPQQRFVSCREVVDLIQYLVSPLAKSITGQNIDVAGGVGL